MKITISFGAYNPTIQRQLYDQGVYLSDEDQAMFQDDADAITRLEIHGLISKSQAHKEREKLMKAITARVKPLPVQDGQEPGAGDVSES